MERNWLQFRIMKPYKNKGRLEMFELKKFRFFKPDGEPLNPQQVVEYGVILPHFLPKELQRCGRTERVIRVRRHWCSMLYRLANSRCPALVEPESDPEVSPRRKPRLFTALNCKPAILPVEGSDNHVCRFKWCPFCRARLASSWYEKIYPVIKRNLEAGGRVCLFESKIKAPLYREVQPQDSQEILLTHTSMENYRDRLLKKMGACGSIVSLTIDNERADLRGPVPIETLRLDGSSSVHDHIPYEDIEIGWLRCMLRGIVMYSRRRQFLAERLQTVDVDSVYELTSPNAFHVANKFGWLFRYPYQWPKYPTDQLMAWVVGMQQCRLTTVRGEFYFYQNGETE